LENAIFVQTSKTIELFANLFTGGNNPNNSYIVVRAYLAILSTKGCKLLLHRVFSSLAEIFRSSIRVTIKPEHFPV
jgi:hypothetical protein